MSANNNESLLIRSILNGDTSAFARIIDNYHSKIRAFIYKRCSNTADCDDIVQEVFIAIHKNLHQYKSEFSFSAWIFGIARNKTNEHFRKISRYPTAVKETKDIVHEETPDHQIFITEQTNYFWNEAKRLLNEEQFTAIWLKYQQELQITEIAEHMGISLSNVKIQLFRARKSLSKSNIINKLSS